MSGKLLCCSDDLAPLYLPDRGGREEATAKFDTHDLATEQKTLLHINLFLLAPVTGPPGRVSGQKDLCSLVSEDRT